MLRTVALAAAVFVLAGAMRFVGLAREPLFVDEVFSARFSSVEGDRLLDRTAKDVHPPLHYLGLRAWRGVFGDSVWDLRAYSLIWSLVGLAFLVLLARDLVATEEHCSWCWRLREYSPRRTFQ